MDLPLGDIVDRVGMRLKMRSLRSLILFGLCIEVTNLGLSFLYFQESHVIKDLSSFKKGVEPRGIIFVLILFYKYMFCILRFELHLLVLEA